MNTNPNSSPRQQQHQNANRNEQPQSEVGRHDRTPEGPEQQAFDELGKQIQAAVVDFAVECGRRGIWRDGHEIKDVDEMRASTIGLDVRSWIDREKSNLGSATINHHFCRHLTYLIVPLFKKSEQQQENDFAAAIRNELWPQVKKLWGNYVKILAASNDLTLFLQRHGVALLNYTAFASDRTRKRFRDRFVRVSRYSSSSPAWLFDRSLVLDFKNEDFAEEYNKVLIINGASGSGKSILSLQYAFFRHNNVVFFLNGCLAGWTESVEESEKGLSRAERNKIRNKKALDAVVRVMTSFLGDPTRFKNTSVETATSPHIVFVFDDVGETPRFVRALCSASAQIAKAVAEMLFGNHPAHRQRIHFIAVGTGANAVIDEPGSTSEIDQVVELVGDSTIYSKLVAHHFCAGTRIRTLLERLAVRRPSYSPCSSSVAAGTSSPDLPRSLSPNEQLCADFVTNPRACVLFLQQPLELWPLDGEASEIGESTADSFSTYDQLLGTWIIKATTNFVGLNALDGFTTPISALRFSFAADVFRLPFLPLDKDLLPVKQPVPQLSFTLPNALVIKGGILVDGARYIVAPKVDDSLFDLHRVAFPPSNAQNDDGGSAFTPDIDVPKNVVQPDDMSIGNVLFLANKSGRYKVDVAQGSMLRLLDGVSARDDDWATMETRFAEFGKAVGGSSRFIELIMSRFSPTRLAQLQLFDEEVNSKVDPLFHLKQWLRFGEDIAGAVMYRLAVSGLSEYDKFCRVAETKYAHCVQQLKKVIVLVPNKEKESFADVIFLGPGKVILLQIKRLTSVHSSINFNDEFLKMCAISCEQHDEVGDDFVTEIRAVVPHRKQQMTHEQFDAAKQEYENNKRTVALHKEYVNLKDKRKDTMEAEERKKCEADYAALAKLLAPKIKHHLRRRFLRKLTDLCRVASSPARCDERQTSSKNSGDAAATVEPPVVRVYCGIVLGLSLPDADKNEKKCSEELAKYMTAFNDARCTATNDEVKVVAPLAKGPSFKVEDLKFFCFDARNTNPLHPLPLYVSEASEHDRMV